MKISLSQLNARLQRKSTAPKVYGEGEVYLMDVLTTLLSCMQSYRLENQLVERHTYILIRQYLNQIKDELERSK